MQERKSCAPSSPFVLPVAQTHRVFQPGDVERKLAAASLYRSIRGDHPWGERFDPEPGDDVLDLLADMAPREMRRAPMTGFGDARLAHHNTTTSADLPKGAARKGPMDFIQ